MQYFGKAIGTVSRTWNSLNPSTLTGAIDVVVVKQSNGDLHCSAFHVRFGKLSLFRPSEKVIDFYVNGEKIKVPMKLGEGGEAFFVFGTNADVPESLLTSPVVSPAGSPPTEGKDDGDVEFLDINATDSASKNEESHPTHLEAQVQADIENEMHDTNEEANEAQVAANNVPENDNDRFEHLRQKPDQIDEIIHRLQQVKIPTTQDNGSVIMDATGYQVGGQNTKELEKVVSNLLHDPSSSSPPLSPMASPPASPRRPEHSYTQQFNNVHIDQGSTIRYVKTLRLSSPILQTLNLKPGKNEMKFVVRSNQATVNANIFLWDSSTPVVISDIDGTITKSDAMGHLMTLVGRDWTHAGVGKLFTDISRNGYNIMYLTSRSVGLADGTRGYLESIDQDGIKLPPGPVILSPDRTMAALRREVIMRKPELFKMACLRDIQKLFEYDFDFDSTPFFAGFGNRITDALSYRSVGVPSTKIFTIDTDSEVKLELLELTGVKSSYVLISDLVDQLFPPVNTSTGEVNNAPEFSDATFWRQPIIELSDDEEEKQVAVQSTGADASGGLDWRDKLGATFSDGESEYATDSESE